MPGQNYYLLTSLPALGEFETAPPMGLFELRNRVRESLGPAELVDALLLSDDLLQRQAFLTGETKEVSPAVLTVEQIRDEAPLPDELADEDERSPEQQLPRVAQDRLWARYYRNASAVARKHGSEFLRQWVACEVALRNALATERAKALGLDPDPYLVAPELGDPNADFSSLLGEWNSAADPLAGLRVLDLARWQWLADCDGWFTFTNDEVAAYAARLMLLQRWHRLQTRESDSQAVGRESPDEGNAA